MNNIDYSVGEPQQPVHDSESLFKRTYTAESGLVYPEQLPPEETERVQLDLKNTPLEVYYPNIAQAAPEEFTMLRRDGFGGSDSSVLLNVNPYMTLQELIQQKATKELTEEEKAISEQTAVMKGNDLEPLIIDKFEQAMVLETIKPSDMYVFTEFPYLKMNFDGVTGTPDQYLPVEIKVCTKKGEKHYDPLKAFYVEREGYKFVPTNHAITNNSIQTKAILYGIPAYYYTQVQMQMMGLNAPFGFLAVLFESTWTMHVYFIHRDQSVWNALKVQGFKAWEQVKALKEKKGL